MRLSTRAFWKRCWRSFSQFAGALAWLVLSLGLPLHLALEPTCHGVAPIASADVGSGLNPDSDGEPVEHPASEHELASVSRVSSVLYLGVMVPSEWSWRDDFRPRETVSARPPCELVVKSFWENPADPPRGPPTA